MMKVLYDNEGFIWRDEMEDLQRITGMTDSELIYAMENDFQGVTFEEAIKMVDWFRGNQYLLEPIKEFEQVFAKDMNDMLEIIISRNVSVISHDETTGFVKAMDYPQGMPVIKFFKLVD